MALDLSKRIQTAVTAGFALFLAGYLLAACTPAIVEKKVQESPFKPLPDSLVSTNAMEDVDFSRFRHDSERHRDVPCLLCHQQKDSAQRPQFSSHTPCAGCHAPQFADNEHPICTICHTAKGTSELKHFPSIRSFTAEVEHSAHFKETACSTCHKPTGKGMSVPAGAGAHATCFQCHTQDKVVGERNIGSCSTCHQQGRPERLSSGATNVGFNFEHAKHRNVSCDSCHATTSDRAPVKIQVAMHSNAANSCATCHNGKRAFGASSFADCRRCHSEMPAGRSFGVDFDHGKHASQNCAVCHKTGGVNFSVPNGQAAHTTCFQCHSPSKATGSVFTAGRCFVCHRPGGNNDIKASNPVIPGNFSHTKHAGFDCDSCHNKVGGKMDVPIPVMHRPSGQKMGCAACHNNEIAFGEDFSSCKRCHTGGKFRQ
ncbi:MAG: hypothetical protein KF736_00440 [Acidobacteria bacterium]|nr:hypothetical protein [Acidobacteriota bacterium]MCW5947943.1 hypothetical protein [Pyrinomonadaceae bacterium]